MNIQLTDTWKEGLARLIRRRPFKGLLAWGVRLIVPRQRVGVALVTFNENEEVLLLRHVFHTASSWGLPGGWLNRNESPQDGLVRELGEETGRELIIGPPIQAAHEGPPSHIVMAYLGWLQPGPMRLNSEIIEARWFDLDRLPQPLWSFTESAISAGLSLKRLLADEPVAQ
ncbi:MAG TPA: NUDIX hydrolase [Promineifilum sp.]|nr:NUDIX hydrolase [Promineifilum sp.]HRO23887.1 NUDIX hydrolase [Promineifilum sp.]HRO89789.1 NUDIX hydrolase [Promineifilum sp.]HRQ12630.1 NUDIX hydrolase [Promineifilum sp.]